MSHDLLRSALVELQPYDPSPRLYPISQDKNAWYEHKVHDLQLTFEEGILLVNDHPYFNKVQEHKKASPMDNESKMKLVSRINRLYHLQL